jgi:hypothetical protein
MPIELTMASKKHLYYSFDYWKNRAEEARVLAERMDEEWARRMMLGVAADYDRQADHERARAARRDGGSN